jgi:hypothetical protein
MTMGEFRKETAHIPDNWLLQICDDNQEIFEILDLLIMPDLGDRVVVMFNGEPAR